MQTIDLEKLDYRAIHQQLSRVYELPTEEQKTTRAALQRAYTEKMQEALRQFIGSERFVQMGRPFQRFLYTEGVAFLAKETRSYWLLDMIASYYPKYRGEPFLSAHLKAQDGAGQFSLKVDEKVTVPLTGSQGLSEALKAQQSTPEPRGCVTVSPNKRIT